jgi:hypothetical protein
MELRRKVYTEKPDSECSEEELQRKLKAIRRVHSKADDMAKMAGTNLGIVPDDYSFYIKRYAG